MSERGMIFNAEMVNAILSGRKTQTRRPIKWKQTRFTEIANVMMVRCGRGRRIANTAVISGLRVHTVRSAIAFGCGKHGK